MPPRPSRAPQPVRELKAAGSAGTLFLVHPGALDADVHLTLARATVGDIAAARGRRLHQPALAGKIREQALQKLPALAAQEATEHRLGSQAGDHARHPHALAAGVEVHALALGPLPLERDREQRVRPEDGDAGR